MDVLAGIADRRQLSISQVALNWATRKPCVDTVIIGARNEQQLRDNLAAASWILTDAEVESLDDVSAIPLSYPHWHHRKFATERNPPLPPSVSSRFHGPGRQSWEGGLLFPT